MSKESLVGTGSVIDRRALQKTTAVSPVGPEWDDGFVTKDEKSLNVKSFTIKELIVCVVSILLLLFLASSNSRSKSQKPVKLVGF